MPRKIRYGKLKDIKDITQLNHFAYVCVPAAASQQFSLSSYSVVESSVPLKVVAAKMNDDSVVGQIMKPSFFGFYSWQIIRGIGDDFYFLCK